MTPDLVLAAILLAIVVHTSIAAVRLVTELPGLFVRLVRWTAS